MPYGTSDGLFVAIFGCGMSNDYPKNCAFSLSLFASPLSFVAWLKYKTRTTRSALAVGSTVF